MARNSDVAWEKFGRNNPYYGVVTEDRYRDPDPADFSAFFASGEEHIADVFAAIERLIDPEFRPTRALDFGCGVGRLVIPLAQRCQEVVGVDISPSMLAEANRNVRDRGLKGVRFALSDDGLTSIEGSFDLVHSFVVFQHMPVAAGMRVLDAMLQRLAPGGVGALHFAYARDVDFLHRLALKALYRMPVLNYLANIVQRHPVSTPLMQMNDYDMGRVLAVLQRAGCIQVHVEFTDHYGHMGAMVYFQRPT